MADERVFLLVGHFLFIHRFVQRRTENPNAGRSAQKAHFIQAEKP
jgi:hypothetical protein